MICSNDIFETSLDSLGDRTKIECDDEEMTEVLNIEVEMLASLDATEVHYGSKIPKKSRQILMFLHQNGVIEFAT